MARSRWWVLAPAMACVVMIGSSAPSGHTPISSRWNYNEHLFPVFRDQCGRCHIEGGVAPMSLVTYRDAFPWTQSIREEILGLRMPPWQAEDGFGTFRNGHALSARDMDMILEWSSGGYPQGPRDQVPPVPVLSTDWSLGEPSLTLEMSTPFDLDAGTSEAVRYFVLSSGTGADQIVSAIDFRPDAQAVVRGAAVFVDTTGTARMLDDADAAPGFATPEGQTFPLAPPVAIWIPGQAPISSEGTGHLLPKDADIVLRIHYKKTWITEGQAFSDQSRLGLYFADANAAAIGSMLVASPASVAGREVKFSHDIEEDVSVLALLPEVDIDSSELQVEAVKPDGTRIPLLWLREPDSSWTTRFWFDAPIELPRGSQLEVTAMLDAAAKRSGSGSLLGGDITSPIRFSLDYVSGSVSAN